MIYYRKIQKGDSLMTLYFEGLEIKEEIKAMYKELAKKHHPDLGGNIATMQAINSQYEQCLKGQYQREGKSITEIDELLSKDINLRNKLNEILAIDGLAIELCGSWLWITGKTQENKDILKEAKFKWARKKQAWYWREEQAKSYNRKAFSLEEIRYRHGSEKLKFKQNKQIA